MSGKSMVRCVHGLGGPLQGRRTGGRGWQWVTSVPAAMVASARSSSAAVDGRTCQGRTSRPSPPRGRVEWCGVAEAAGEALTGAARAAGAPRPRMPRFCDASAGALSESSREGARSKRVGSRSTAFASGSRVVVVGCTGPPAAADGVAADGEGVQSRLARPRIERRARPAEVWTPSRQCRAARRLDRSPR